MLVVSYHEHWSLGCEPIMALTRPPSVLHVFLTLLLWTASASTFHQEPEQPYRGLKFKPFYERLASKVDSLAVAVDFHAQESSPAVQPVDSASHGENVLRHWSALHNASQPLVNASELGLELGGYALQLRDQKRLRAVAQAHAAMHETASSGMEQPMTQRARSLSEAGHAQAASGSDLLREWSASHSASSQHPVQKSATTDGTAQTMAPKQSRGTLHPRAAQEVDSRPAHVLKKSESKAFAHAHSMMHDLQSAMPTGGSTETDVSSLGNEVSVPKSTLVTSGDDLLANWDKVHGQQQTRASLRKDLEIASSSASTKTRTLKAKDTTGPQSPELSIREDLASLRSTMWSLHVDNGAARLHQVMHNLEDAPIDAGSSREETSATRTGAEAGNDELQTWVKRHAPKHETIEKAVSLKLPNALSNSFPEASSNSRTLSDDMAAMRTSAQELHRSRLHDAMHNIASDAPDLDTAYATPLVTKTMKKAGADTLEQWSQAHKKVQRPKFIKYEVHTQRPASVASPRQEEQAAIEEHSLGDVLKVEKWHSSALHNAMRSIGDDLGDVGTVAEDTHTQLVAEKVGADTLDQWTKAHQPKKAPFFMKREALLSPSTRAELPAEVESVSSPPLVPKDVDKMQTSVSKWRRSNLHDAMRSVGNDAPDESDDAVKPVEYSSSAVPASKSLEAAGVDALDEWTKAHSKAKRQKFMIPLPDSVQTPASAPARLVNLPMSNDAPSMEDVSKKRHESALHSAMRSIGDDLPDNEPETVDSESQRPTGTLQAAGADALASWSRAHEKHQQSRFMMPVPRPEEPARESASSNAAGPSSEMHVVAHASSQIVEEWRASAKKLHQAAVHEAMQKFGNDVSDSDLISVRPLSVASDQGHDLMETWSKDHAETKPKPNGLIDMYPPTPPPETDMLSLARARGFGQKVEASLKYPPSTAAHLHEAMQSIVGETSSFTDANKPSEQLASQAVASAGADELEKWSKAHQKVQSPKFLMPAHTEESKELEVKSSAPPKDTRSEHAIEETAADMRTALKHMHESTVHEAMHKLGDAVSEAEVKQPQPQEAVDNHGQDLMSKWSTSHAEKPQRKMLVDMYPPTVAPDTDMMALAMARGFGKKVEMSLKAPVSKAGQLHQAMQSIEDSSSLADGKEQKEEPSQAFASAGADILSQWSKTHRAASA